MTNGGPEGRSETEIRLELLNIATRIRHQPGTSLGFTAGDIIADARALLEFVHKQDEKKA